MSKHDQYWMKHAELASTRCCCASGRQVGCVAVSFDGRMLAMGFNGVPVKIEHPTECVRKTLGLKSGENPHLCGCIHAEINMFLNCAREGVSVKGATLYCTTRPCHQCTGAIINAGIERVVYKEDYCDEAAADLQSVSNVIFEQLKGEIK